LSVTLCTSPKTERGPAKVRFKKTTNSNNVVKVLFTE
jgi:hypothetical protein